MEPTKLLTRIAEVEALPGYRLRVRYVDGADGVVEMAGTIARGGVFEALAGARFGTVQVAGGGRSVCWVDDAGSEIDFDADALRLRLQVGRQAAE